MHPVIYLNKTMVEATKARVAPVSSAMLYGRGVFTTVEQAKFETVLRRCPNVSYSGPYLPQQDLERLYREVDFAWALDLEHTDHNSRWLMPCRFYEAGYYGVPCLAAAKRRS